MSQRGAARRESVCNSLEEKQKSKERSCTQTENERQKQKSEKDKSQMQLDKEFSQFRAEIKELFKQFDEKMDQKLSKLEKKFTSVLDEVKKEIQNVRLEVTYTKEDVKELNSKVCEVEKSVSFQAEMQETMQEKQDDRFRKVNFELEEMKKKLMLMEKHDRKYNLLFYGMPEEEKEDLNVKMRSFFKDDLGIEENRVKAMQFVNCHRTPYDGEGPKPVILRFVSYEDRELVYSKSYMQVLRDRKMRILSDLPLEMKIKRSKLAKEAYKLRQKGLKTRIIEKGLFVYLEVRKTKEDVWERKELEI